MLEKQLEIERMKIESKHAKEENSVSSIHTNSHKELTIKVN